MALLYGWVARLRERRWRGRAHRLDEPVLSVGNLTFGGTGKTPFVIYACRQLRDRGRRPVILSRGYRAGESGVNDEAQVIAAHLPGVPHLSQPDRYSAARGFSGDADCFVLDDGFQHHPLARDADVVLVDCTDPFGGGFCPPAGTLREPMAGLGRADLVVLTRADLVTAASLGNTMRAVRERTDAPVVTSAFSPECDEPLAGRDVLVASGIGNPRAFRHTVESMGGRVASERRFPDHHDYSAADAVRLAAGDLPVVVTEKDAVKLRPLWHFDTPLLVVRIAFTILDGEAYLDALFDGL